MRKEVGGVHTAPLTSIYLLLYLFQIKPFVFLPNSILVAMSGAQQFSFMGKKINQSINQSHKRHWRSRSNLGTYSTNLPPLILHGQLTRPHCLLCTSVYYQAQHGSPIKAQLWEAPLQALLQYNYQANSYTLTLSETQHHIIGSDVCCINHSDNKVKSKNNFFACVYSPAFISGK